MMKPDSPTPVRQRRAGTFTLGITLVVFGFAALAAMFLPRMEQVQLLALWCLRLSPLILIALGVEVLLAARGGRKVKYDWLGMLLCFLLVCAALCMAAAAWVLLYAPEYGLFYW